MLGQIFKSGGTKPGGRFYTNKFNHFVNFNSNSNSDENFDWKTPSILGSDPVTRIYGADFYLAACNLATVFEPEEIFFPLIALMLAHILLEKNPGWLEMIQIPSSAQAQEFRNFLAERILHHFEIFCKNVFTFEDFDRLNGAAQDSKSDSETELEFVEFGSRVFTTAR